VRLTRAPRGNPSAVAPRTVIAIAAVLALAGCGGSHHPKQRTTRAARAPDASAQLTALLNTRAAAIQAGDAAKLSRTSAGAQRRRDRRAASAAKPLPLSRVSITARSTDIGDGRAVIEAETAYAFTGVDSRFV
jgi:uncharacterized lipoprotein